MFLYQYIWQFHIRRETLLWEDHISANQDQFGQNDESPNHYNHLQIRRFFLWFLHKPLNFFLYQYHSNKQKHHFIMKIGGSVTSSFLSAFQNTINDKYILHPALSSGSQWRCERVLKKLDSQI